MLLDNVSEKVSFGFNDTIHKFKLRPALKTALASILF